MSKSKVAFKIFSQGIGGGILAGVAAGILVGAPLIFWGVIYGIISGIVIGGVVGAINGLCLAAVTVTRYYPAGMVPDPRAYRAWQCTWMAIQTTILTFIGSHLMWPGLGLDFYAYWLAPVAGFILAVPVTRWIVNSYLSIHEKKKRAL